MEKPKLYYLVLSGLATYYVFVNYLGKGQWAIMIGITCIGFYLTYKK